ncbi:hypothetical protein Pth03_57840 [Planotetraspora thailandica]|uniref:Histidine kinase/HSP90-like ATPase domain-containing protein n=1 Tax=Planotetraspora thailandica TaxID=487172 RepID=A0A8J3XYI3_9ACTN|nr:ATP-binding protein [Planotetraspora thailandica]GII57395.1 hypothetical protein Pth03_57840 [Planotetraspora thailandica]
MEISGDGAGNRVARLAGAREQVRHARRLVSAVLGRDHPRHDDCVLLASEIVTNAVVHSRSGQGGTFVITVSRLPDRVRITVKDDGSAGPPCAGHAVPDGTGGRGIPLLDALSDRWGLVREDGRNDVWFEIYGEAAPGPSGADDGDAGRADLNHLEAVAGHGELVTHLDVHRSRFARRAAEQRQRGLLSGDRVDRGTGALRQGVGAALEDVDRTGAVRPGAALGLLPSALAGRGRRREREQGRGQDGSPHDRASRSA